MEFSKKLTDLAKEAELALAPIFANIDEISFYNTNRIIANA